MPRFVLPALIVGATLIALALTWWALGRATGAPTAALAEHDPGPFRRIEVAGTADVTLLAGPREHVSAETPARGLSIDLKVRGDTLDIVVHDRRRWWTSLGGGGARSARVYVTYRELDSIVLSGAVKLSGSGIATPQLQLVAAGGSSVRLDGLKTRLLRVSGAGALKAALSGEATEQDISISGAGEYIAHELVSERASVSVSGVGRVRVRVEKELSASISGAGSIEYYGDPKVRERVSGVGRVKRRDALGPATHRFQVAAWPLGSGLPACLLL
jgi:hypothetical protein